jgi:SNF2 family DNA or RNA helicase
MLIERKPVPWEPHPYQKLAIKFLLEHGAAALFLDPGLGKTSITLAAIKILKGQKLLDRALVIAPLRVCYSVWPREVKKWENFNGLKIAVLHGPEKESLLDEEADIYVINPEGLAWLTLENRLKKLRVDTLVVDESSKFKHTSTKRFKMLKPYLPKFRRRWILTGTPAPNGLMDLFGQIYILDLGKCLGGFITAFRNNFFDATGFGGYTWVPRPGSAERIQELLKPLALRLAARDYLELPELVTTPQTDIVVQLPDNVRTIYTQMHEDMIARLSEMEVVTAVSAAAASMKCRQISNGGIYKRLDYKPAIHSDGWEDLHDAKTDALEDLYDELQGQPLLVAYEFEMDMERIRKRFPGATFSADYPPKKFTEIEQQWNNGEIPMLVCQPQSVGHGLNLQEGQAMHIVFYSQIWDLEVYQQFIERVLRQGNHQKRVFVYHIICENTVDRIVLRALARKDTIQTALLDSLKGDA